eukprot:TRINITY_DN5527_c0_g1_i1.p1 TRINITY_DN5527_c0_g1~~TRINITY_DN5527_c0_g1_i1.p1  ORF type:complete len:127 (-),score=29.36 TRINITY_DN5527_c0_g1_i1:917-1297(-)
MSWQSYIDDHLVGTKVVSDALICGHDGNVWATSPKLKATPQELKKVIDNIGNTSVLSENGVMVGGVKYMYLSGTDQVIRAKKGKAGLHIMKTTQAVIVSRYEEPTMPEQCATITEKLGDYFLSVGY